MGFMGYSTESARPAHVPSAASRLAPVLPTRVACCSMRASEKAKVIRPTVNSAHAKERGGGGGERRLHLGANPLSILQEAKNAQMDLVYSAHMRFNMKARS